MDVLPLLPAFLTFPHIEGIFCSVPQKFKRNTSSSSPWPSSLPRGGREPVLSCLGWELSVFGHHPDAHCFLIHLCPQTHTFCCFLPGPYRVRLILDEKTIFIQDSQGLGVWSLYHVEHQEAHCDHTYEAVSHLVVSVVKLTCFTPSVWLLCCLSVGSKFGSG